MATRAMPAPRAAKAATKVEALVSCERGPAFTSCKWVELEDDQFNVLLVTALPAPIAPSVCLTHDLLLSRTLTCKLVGSGASPLVCAVGVPLAAKLLYTLLKGVPGTVESGFS